MKHGISLIELMIVILIIAILATTTLINSRFLSAFLIKSEVCKIVHMCQAARQSALAYNRIETIKFDVEHHVYRWRDRREQLPPTVRFGVLSGVKGPPANPVVTLSHPMTFRDDTITCYPDGIIQAGTIYIIDDRATTMYAISNAVSQFSYLRTYIYQGTWNLIKEIE